MRDLQWIVKSNAELVRERRIERKQRARDIAKRLHIDAIVPLLDIEDALP